jgi:predicted AAA+ superfamily ATPase
MAFSAFMKLCAGRTAQEVNLSALGTDAAISHNTARAWLSVLETSYLVLRLPAWHANIRKQVVKAPKLHFLDSGLLCYLLGIREPEQLRQHPLRGAIFESWVVSELYKSHLHRGERPNLHHYRESRGLEMDVLVNLGDRLYAIEIKSAATVAADFFKHFAAFAERTRGTGLPEHIKNVVVFGGEPSQVRSAASVVGWRDVGGIVE